MTALFIIIGTALAIASIGYLLATQYVRDQARNYRLIESYGWKLFQEQANNSGRMYIFKGKSYTHFLSEIPLMDTWTLSSVGNNDISYSNFQWKLNLTDMLLINRILKEHK